MFEDNVWDIFDEIENDDLIVPHSSNPHEGGQG